MGICLSMRAEQQDFEVKLLAVTALHNSLTFVENQLKAKVNLQFPSKIKC